MFNKYDERLEDAVTRVLKSSFYYGPINPEGFYKYHVDGYRFYKTSIMYYCLNNFYDINADKFSIPDDLPYFLPKSEDIHEFLNDIDDNPFWGNDSLNDIGHENLVRIYKSIFGFIENL